MRDFIRKGTTFVRKWCVKVGIWVLCSTAGVAAGDYAVELEDEPDSTDVTIGLAPAARPLYKSIVAWPFEKVVQPLFSTVMYPIIPPLRYMVNEKVVERAIDLVTLGKRNQIMLYPTFNFKPGTSTMMGASYLHKNLVGSLNDRYFVNYARFVNSDWNLRSQYGLEGILGSDLATMVEFRYRQDSDQTFMIDELNANPYFYTDSSWNLNWMVSNAFKSNSKFRWTVNAGIEHKKFGEPKLDEMLLPRLGGDSLAIFNQFDRGFYQHFWQYPLGFALRYDTKNSPYATTSGRVIQGSFTIVTVGGYRNEFNEKPMYSSLNHSYKVLEMVYQSFYLLGKTKYELSGQENRENQEFLKDISLEKSMDLFRSEQIRTTLFERKVLALQFRMRQVFENETGFAPFSSYSELNANTPLRGYSRSFYGKGLVSASMEYRWPIIRMVDGVVFNEYGYVGDSWAAPEMGEFLNSWGFGVRIRTGNLFISRLQVGFHGLNGVNVIVTVAPEYR